MQRKTNKIKTVCVYCGASKQAPQKHLDAAFDFGKALAENDFQLMYGGGANGLMGQVAFGMMEHGGYVTGVIPQFLVQAEGIKIDIPDLRIVETMHERKRTMFDGADAFVILPGGLGTLEEFFEVITWKQLGQHKKPILIANIDNYWGPLKDLITSMFEQNYLYNFDDNIVIWADNVTDIINWCKAQNTQLTKA